MARNSLFLPNQSRRSGYSSTGRPSGRRWLPSDLAQVFCWTDAGSLTGVLNGSTAPAANGETVDTWRSEVGSFDFVNTTDSRRPVFTDDGTGANGQPYLLFDGVDDRLVFSGTFQTATAGEVFAVVGHDRAADNNAWAFFGLGRGSATTPWIYQAVDGNVSAANIKHVDNAVGTQQSPDWWGRARAVHLVNIRSDDTNISVFNGSVLANTPGAGPWYGDLTSHDRATIGGLTRTTFTLPWKGKIYELVFSSSLLSHTDRSRLLHYLRDKYRTHFWAAIGDSITKRIGWPEVMAAELENTAFESNAFIEHADGGEKTADALSRWNGDIKGKGYDGVALLSTINDVLTDVPTATSTANLEAIIAEATNAGHQVAISTIMPFGNYSGWTSGRQTLLDDLNTWIRDQAAADPRIGLIEAYDNMGDTNPQDLLAAYDSGDGLHPNTAGDQQMAGLVKTTLESMT